MKLSVTSSKIHAQSTITVFYLQLMMHFNGMQNVCGSIVSEVDERKETLVELYGESLQSYDLDPFLIPRLRLFSLFPSLRRAANSFCGKLGLCGNSVLKPRSSHHIYRHILIHVLGHILQCLLDLTVSFKETGVSFPLQS